MANFSGTLTSQVRNNAIPPKTFAEKLSTIHYAVSLGDHRSLLFYIPSNQILQTSFRLTESEEANYRHYAGEEIYRLSVGIEDPGDLCADLDNALREL